MRMTDITRDSNVRYDQQAIQTFVASFLCKLGIEPETTLLFHSSFSQLSRQGYSAELFLESIVKFLKDGTLALPTLSWREVSPIQPRWNESTTCTNVGVLSEVFRTKFADRRSLHPTHSVAAIGKQTDFLLKDHHLDVRPCSDKSPWGKLKNVEANILMMGVDMDTCTLIHHLEETYAPELYLLEPVESYLCESKNSLSIEVNTRRHRKLYRNFYKFRDLLYQQGQLKRVDVEGYIIFAFKALDLVSCVTKEFEKTTSATLAKPGELSKWM